MTARIWVRWRQVVKGRHWSSSYGKIKMVTDFYQAYGVDGIELGAFNTLAEAKALLKSVSPGMRKLQKKLKAEKDEAERALRAKKVTNLETSPGPDRWPRTKQPVSVEVEVTLVLDGHRAKNSVFWSADLDADEEPLDVFDVARKWAEEQSSS